MKSFSQFIKLEKILESTGEDFGNNIIIGVVTNFINEGDLSKFDIKYDNDDFDIDYLTEHQIEDHIIKIECNIVGTYVIEDGRVKVISIDGVFSDFVGKLSEEIEEIEDRNGIDIKGKLNIQNKLKDYNLSNKIEELLQSKINI